MDNMTEGYDFARLSKAWHMFRQRSTSNEQVQSDWKEFFNFLKESCLSRKFAMNHDWQTTFIQNLDRLRAQMLYIKPELFNLVQEVDCLFSSIKNDRFLNETSQSLTRLSQDLFLDKNGNFEFKPDALKQIRDIILPEFVEQFKFIALPTIQGQDDTQSYKITNAVCKSGGLTPDDILIQNNTDLRLTKKDDNSLKTRIHVLIQGLNFDLQEMHVKYHRKVFPSLSEEGNFNVRSSGKGVKLDLWMSADTKDPGFLKVDDVDVTIAGLTIYDSHVSEHTVLFAIFKPLLKTMIRREAEKAVEDKLKETLFSIRGLSEKIQK
jgi:hypothetical protein